MTYNSGKKTSSRRRVLAGAVIIEACLGVLLAWPLFTAKLCNKAGAYCISASQIALMFSISLVAFAATVILSGNILNRRSSGRLVLAGGLTLALGYGLAGLLGSTDVVHLTFIGIVAGAGAGLVYLVPVFLAMRWFPDIKGLAVGLTVAGFGLGGILWAGLAESLTGFEILGIGNLRSVYIILGALLALFIVIGRLLIVDVPADPGRDEWLPMSDIGLPLASQDQLTPRGLLSSRMFYALFIAFFLSALAGLIVFSNILPFGIDSLRARGLEVKLAVHVAALVVFLFQVMGIVGSVVWGVVSDRFGRWQAVFLLCLLQGISVFLLYYTRGSAQSVILFSSLAGANLGGSFSLFPLLAAECFDDRNMGISYGPVFASCIIAGLAGPEIVVFIRDAAMNSTDPSEWLTPFMVAGVACLAAAAMVLLARKPAGK